MTSALSVEFLRVIKPSGSISTEVSSRLQQSCFSWSFTGFPGDLQVEKQVWTLLFTLVIWKQKT